ncbi:MAG: 50S ribosomal protein L5 [Candidatus Moranbacteria bacterium]|nr:50S ribosomal protein L5 [Candidatus Moranbacteria bacterium]
MKKSMTKKSKNSKKSNSKTVAKDRYVSSLKNRFEKDAVNQLKKKFKLKSSMATPKIDRIVVNAGIGKWLDSKDMQEKIFNDLKTITGQKPVDTLSKKAVSGFKIKEGQKIGLKVTLRGQRMYDFLERLIVEALPRIRDFQGIPVKNFGRRGNLNIGIKEHTAFAEIDSESLDYTFSFGINIVNTAQERKQGIELMKLLGMPINFEIK